MVEQVGAPPSGVSGLGTSAARGAAVTLGAQGGKILIQVASVVVLARLLSPHDYGLIAMVATIIGVGELLRDFGLSSAAIQAPILTTRQRDNLFWMNTGIGIALAVVVFFLGAPLLSLVYHQPAVIPIAHSLCLIFIVNGLTTQYRADLVRKLRFSRLAAADIIAPLLALGLAVVAALLGMGFWALVIQQLTLSVVTMIIVTFSAGWLPRRFDRREPTGALLRFGWHLLATQLIGYLSNNVDNFTIGVRFGSISLGYYSRAFQLLMMPLNQVRTPLTTVALPILSRLSTDAKRFSDYIAQGQLALGYTIVAGLGLVIGAAHPITQILLGEKWLTVAPLLSLLAAAGVFQTLAFVGYWVYVARGLTGDLFRYTLLASAIKVACIILGSQWGVIGVAVGYAVAPAIEWPISIWWLSRRTSIPVRQLYGGALRIQCLVAATAASSGALVYAMRSLSAVLQLGSAVCAALLVYGLGALLVPPVRRDVAVVLRQVRMIRGRVAPAK